MGWWSSTGLAHSCLSVHLVGQHGPWQRPVAFGGWACKMVLCVSLEPWYLQMEEMPREEGRGILSHVFPFQSIPPPASGAFLQLLPWATIHHCLREVPLQSWRTKTANSWLLSLRASSPHPQALEKAEEEDKEKQERLSLAATCMEGWQWKGKVQSEGPAQETPQHCANSPGLRKKLWTESIKSSSKDGQANPVHGLYVCRVEA